MQNLHDLQDYVDKRIFNMDSNNTSDSAANESHSGNEIDPAWIGILEATILCLIMLVAIIGNFLVIAVVYRRRELRRTETHIFIVNLSLTDIFVALLCMPFSMITAVTQEWIFSNALCQLNGFLNVFFLLTSILTLTAISIHKYIGVVQPTKRKIFTRKRTLMAVAWVWMQALLTALTPILGWNEYEHIPGRTQCSVKVPRNNEVSELTNCLFIIICGFVIPLGIMNFSYLKIFRTVKIHTKRVKSHSFGDDQKSAFLNERRITVTLFIILAAFLACWSPFSVLTIYATLAGHELSQHFSVVAYWLGFLNSAMNPLIYALRTKEFRQGYRQIFSMLLPCCFPRVDMGEGDSHIAVLRGRKSLKSEVMVFSKRRRAGTEIESHISEAKNIERNGTSKAQRRKDTTTEARDESDEGRLETANEVSIRNKEMSGTDDSYSSAEATNGGLDNSIEIQDEKLVHRERKEEKEEEEDVHSSDSDLSLSPSRESFLLPWNSIDCPFEQTFPKNCKDGAKSRRKSLPFLSMFTEKHELKKSRTRYRSKSDCSTLVHMPAGSGQGCSRSDVHTAKDKSNPWLQENLSYLNRISPIDLEIIENNY